MSTMSSHILTFVHMGHTCELWEQIREMCKFSRPKWHSPNNGHDIYQKRQTQAGDCRNNRQASVFISTSRTCSWSCHHRTTSYFSRSSVPRPSDFDWFCSRTNFSYHFICCFMWHVTDRDHYLALLYPASVFCLRSFHCGMRRISSCLFRVHLGHNFWSPPSSPLSWQSCVALDDTLYKVTTICLQELTPEMKVLVYGRSCLDESLQIIDLLRRRSLKTVQELLTIWHISTGCAEKLI